MKKEEKIFIIALIVVGLIIIAFLRNINTSQKEIKDYKISCLGENYTLPYDNSAGLTEEKVQDISNKIFAANHNIDKTFKDVSNLTKKDLQLTVWFEMYKLEGKKSCSEEEFVNLLKTIYNIESFEHAGLENTLEYANGTYNFSDIKYDNYEIPIIEKIDIVSEDSYLVVYEVSNSRKNAKHRFKYNALLKSNGDNLYIESITELYLN